MENLSQAHPNTLFTFYPATNTRLYNVNNSFESFPIGAFPRIIRNAIEEATRITMAPMPLVASSALSALSIAVQHLYDVARPNDMRGPCSLFFITIAESGERKTTSDKIFTIPIREFEREHTESNRKAIENYENNLKIWNIKDKLLQKEFEKAIRNKKDSEQAEQALLEHQGQKPFRPALMRMLFDDVSPTAIISSLSEQWPSVGIISDEAGKIFESKTFENIGLYNKLWDGDTVSIDRHRTSGSYTAHDSRLTISLMSQRRVFVEFIEKLGRQARDNGFFSRCLISNPMSTQGTRFIHPQPIDKGVGIILRPSDAKIDGFIDLFTKSIRHLLEKSWQRQESGQSRKIMPMSA